MGLERVCDHETNVYKSVQKIKEVGCVKINTKRFLQKIILDNHVSVLHSGFCFTGFLEDLCLNIIAFLIILLCYLCLFGFPWLFYALFNLGKLLYFLKNLWFTRNTWDQTCLYSGITEWVRWAWSQRPRERGCPISVSL